jgi:hypothetical protein
VGRRCGLVLLVGAALLLAGCGGISSSELEDEAQARGGGLGSTLPIEALDAIEEETGTPIEFTGFNLWYSSVSVTILVPGSDDELDTYTYTSNGDLLDPTPVSGVGPAEEVRPTLMTRDDVAIEDLDDIIDDAIERADFDGGYASNVQVDRTSSDRTTITVSITSPRRSATVTYRGNGEFLEATSS